MNIALFTDTYPPFINGVSTSIYNLATTLKNHGHQVLVVTPRSSDGPYELVDNVLYVPGIKLKKIYGYRLTTLYSSKVFRIVEEFAPDVIHTQTDSTIGQFSKIVAKRLNIPLIYTYHTSIEDYTYYVTHGVLDRIAKRIIRYYSKSVAKSSTEYIIPSTKSKEFMRYTGNDIYMNVIPTGFDFSLFHNQSIDQQKILDFKKQYHINSDTKVFLILGRIAAEKSMDISIEYFAHYHKTHPNKDVRLFVVGDGPQKEELVNLTNELGIDDIVTFIGAVPASEVPFYYHIADIYTSASITETQGLTFMEALVSGDMVIARFDDNLTGTIIEGKTGFFFTDKETFCEKVDKVFALSPQEIDNIRVQAMNTCSVYSIEKFYQSIMGVYKRAIRKYW